MAFDFPLFLRGWSITAPSLLHRWSIVSMEYRWTNDGVTMEYLRRKNEGGTEVRRWQNETKS